MSTKIYDAYKFTHNYSMYELSQIFDGLRTEIKDICDRDILQTVITKTLYFYNFKQVNGNDCVAEMVAKTDNRYIFALTANDFPNSKMSLDEKYKKARESVVEEYATVLSNYYRKNNNYTHKEADELKSTIIHDFV